MSFVRRLQQCMAGMQWRVVVADESHMMRTQNKAPDAFFTEVAAAGGQRGRRLLLLSGTPSLNRPFDLYRQVSPTLGTSLQVRACSCIHGGHQDGSM